VGGGSSNIEMCQAMVWYHPRNDNFFGCYSRPEDEEILAPFNITKFTFMYVKILKWLSMLKWDWMMST